MLWAIALSVLLGVATGSQRLRDSSPPGSKVFSAGSDGYFCFRIPAVVKAPNGDLLAFAEGRKLSCEDHQWNDVVSKRSSDGGKTWGALQVIATESSSSHYVTLGNPAPGVLANGDILLPYCRNNLEVFITKSSDNGHTWSKASDISSQVVGSDWSWVATGPPGSVQLDTGRIVVPADHRSASAGAGSHVFFSDDMGASWTLGELLREGNECQAASLGNNNVILGMRPESGQPRLFSTSSDGGETWSKAFSPTNMVDPGCEGSIVSAGGNDTTNELFLSHAQNPSDRVNMTVFRSQDSGEHWSVLHNVWQGPSAYSSLVVLSEEAIGLLWEAWKSSEGGYSSIYYVQLPRSSAGMV
jgi:sialidase-1